VAAYSEDFVILACTVLIRLKGVMDGWTDGRTDTSTMAKTRVETKLCQFSSVTSLRMSLKPGTHQRSGLAARTVRPSPNGHLFCTRSV